MASYRRRQRDGGTAAGRAPDPGREPLTSVLVAAPDPDMRLYLRLGLDGLAGEVLEAADCREALGRLAGERVALVIADAWMGHDSELLRVLAARGIPLLLLDGGMAGRGSEPGVTAVLDKPFGRRQLRRGIRETLAAAAVSMSREDAQ